MKPPPLLLGAALLFWGWQTGYPLVGAVMGAVLESAHLVKTRWDFADEDFRRIWTFCSLLFLAAGIYAFTDSQGPADFLGLFENPSISNQRTAGNASARTAALLIRWLPMVFFLFAAAQSFSSRDGVPPETISLILSRRWKKARPLGQPIPALRSINVGYPYFVLCLFAASIHSSEDTRFFWGLCPLLAWALWSQRSRRFRLAAWVGALAAAIALGYLGQHGIGQLQHLLESYNPSWFGHAIGGGADSTQSRTALGHIGRLKGSSKIVIRLRPGEGQRAPTLLREASYRNYQSQIWSSRIREDEFTDLNSETNNTSWVLLAGKTNTSRVNVGCYVPRGRALLPLPAGSGRLENLPVIFLKKSGLGAVLAQGPGMVVFDALYGPGVTLDSPPDLGFRTNADLAVLEKERPALDRVVAKLHLAGPSREQKLRAVSAFFAEHFTYTNWQERVKSANTNQTPLSTFLLETHSGHCEYFATASVLLLRRLEIPARYAVGYAVHEASGSGYIVRQRDAHAWCLVWDEATRTWQDFDTTPASWVESEGNRASPLHILLDWWFWIRLGFSKIWWSQSRVRQYVVWTLLPILVVMLYRIIFRRRRRRQRGEEATSEPPLTWPGQDSEFYLLEKKLVALGVARLPSEPLSEWLLRALAEPGLAQARGPLQSLLGLHYRYRFDPQGLSPADRELLALQARACLEKLDQTMASHLRS